MPVRRLPFLLALLLSFACLTHAQTPTQKPGVYNPVADAKATVVAGNVRFTVLTPQLIRMEWASDGKFEDRPSFTFLNRHLPVPELHVTRQGNTVLLETSALKLHYTGDGKGKLTADNLAVTFMLNGNPVVWHPGMADRANLMGTTRTLDRADGDNTMEPVGPSLISRDGWVVVDDTKQPLFDGDNFSFTGGEKSEWPWVVRRSDADRQDLYLFAYGHDYKLALEDYRKVSGPVPLPPRWAFGAWWTRYWPYTDQGLDDIIKGYADNNVPLDVLVIDMDWHKSRFQIQASHEVDQSPAKQYGWTGYTWNKSLFPYPEEFLQKLHREDIKVSLNLHPADGVQTWEDAYPQMARAMGIDPATKKYVPFDILSKKFAQNYMDILHHPLEKQGVDFWWLDWQQAALVATPGVDSTWWLNYVHFTDQQREGKRPLLFGRWGGLGNQRYQTGFTGDVVISWASLAYQPYFTATSANVAYAYWSHDIGGHMPGPTEPELYTRWVQWGTFSPILRTHTSLSPYGERRIWAYPVPYSQIMRESFRQRYAMLPYIYTEGRRTYDTGIAFLRPLYYDWPEAKPAYDHKDEYLFGENLIVAPVVTPVDKNTALAKEKVWIPAGEWVEQSSGKHFTGPLEVERQFTIAETPLYFKAGAITPMAPPMLRTDAKPIDPLILQITPLRDGQQSSYTVYDDGNDAEKYQQGEAAWTRLSAKLSGAETVVHIDAEKGHYPNMPETRGYEVRLPGTWPPQSVTANGIALKYQPLEGKPGWRYDGNRFMVIITTQRVSVRVPMDVKIRIAPDLVAQQWKLDGLQGIIARLTQANFAMLEAHPFAHPPDVLDDAFETGDRLTYHPETARAEVDHLLAIYAQVLPAVKNSEKNVTAQKIHEATKRTIQDEKSEAFKQRESEYANHLTESIAEIEDSATDLPTKK